MKSYTGGVKGEKWLENAIYAWPRIQYTLAFRGFEAKKDGRKGKVLHHLPGQLK